MPAVERIAAKQFLTPTAIGGHDLTCNPYAGCAHACAYCYAKSIGGQPPPEPWGSVVRVRVFPNHDIPRNTGSKSLFLSSATDCYQPLEATERSTRRILEAICESELRVSILTKSALAVRDIDVLATMRHVKVGFSIALGDEDARFLEPGASRPSERRAALARLHAAGIATNVAVAPILPGMTDVFALIDACAPHADSMMFDTLNLKDPENRVAVFRDVIRRHPELLPLYKEIFETGDRRWYVELRERILAYARTKGVAIHYLYDRS